MYKIVIQVFVIWISLITALGAQCVVDAGENRNLCPEETMNSPKLNGEILSGEVVDVYWESVYYQSGLDKYYYASIMLNDTSVLEPIIEQHFEKTVTYYLTGITANNEICRDSVTLNFSDWMFATVNKMTGKAASDTVQLWIAIGSNWEHTKYEWSPNYMISDTTVSSPLVWNDTTVFYNLKITDELNCTVTDDIFEVYVTTNSVKILNEDEFKVFPNPANSIVHIESEKKIEKVELYSVSGVLMKVIKDEQMDVSNLGIGNYVIKVYFSDKTLGAKILSIAE